MVHCVGGQCMETMVHILIFSAVCVMCFHQMVGTLCQWAAYGDYSAHPDLLCCLCNVFPLAGVFCC